MEQQVVQWTGENADPALTTRVVKQLLQNPEYFDFEDLNSWPAVKVAFPADSAIGTLLQHLTSADLTSCINYLDSLESIDGLSSLFVIPFPGTLTI